MDRAKKTFFLRVSFIFFPVFLSPIYAEAPQDKAASMIADEAPYDNDSSRIYEAPSLVYEVNPFTGLRSIDELFPGLSPNLKKIVMSPSGLKHSFEEDGFPIVYPAGNSGINLYNDYILKKNPSHIIEALIVIPYKTRELDMLDVYNALGRIQKIKEQSITIRNNNMNFFKDATRLESAKRRRPIPDPSPAYLLPVSETIFLRFTDMYIGDFFIQGDIKISLYGITYSMTNFRDVNFSIFRIMKAQRFSAVIYLEPVREGVLIYCMSGLYLPGFIVSRMNLTPNINVRITLLINWITEGLRIQENRKETPVIPFRD